MMNGIYTTNRYFQWIVSSILIFVVYVQIQVVISLFRSTTTTATTSTTTTPLSSLSTLLITGRNDFRKIPLTQSIISDGSTGNKDGQKRLRSANKADDIVNRQEATSDSNRHSPCGNKDENESIIVEKRLLSLRTNKAEEFWLRNEQSGLGRGKVPWFPAINGFDQVVLDDWSETTGYDKLYAVQPGDDISKKNDAQVVGTYLSHWHLLRLLYETWHTLKQRPDALFVFEDDATCVQNVEKRTMQIISQLPEDWDMLYIGGIPTSEYNDSDILDYYGVPMPISDYTFREMLCTGVFGNASSTGPFPPPHGTNDNLTTTNKDLSIDQPYWNTRFIYNSFSYVVNPKRIERVLKVLVNLPENQTPMDIMLAESMKHGVLKVYMPTMAFCVRNKEWPSDNDRSEPVHWKGYFRVNIWGDYSNTWNGFHWDDTLFPTRCDQYIDRT